MAAESSMGSWRTHLSSPESPAAAKLLQALGRERQLEAFLAGAHVAAGGGILRPPPLLPAPSINPNQPCIDPHRSRYELSP